MIRPVNIQDAVTVFVDSEPTDLLTYRLIKSVKQTHKHSRGECISTSESGSNTCIARFKCLGCGEFYNEEMLPAEYERFCQEEYSEPIPQNQSNQ